MDEGTPSKRLVGHGKDEAGTQKGHASGTPTNPRLGAAFAASTSSTASLSTSEARGVMSKPVGTARTPLTASSRHGRPSSSNAPSSGSSGHQSGDYFGSQPSSAGHQPTSPSAIRRATRPTTSEQSTWQAHSRHASRDLPAIREHPSSQRESSSNRPSTLLDAHKAQTGYPVYPNQSFTALSAQVYNAPRAPLWARVHDGFVPTQRAATAHPKNQAVEDHLADIASRQTPVTTPSLFELRPKKAKDPGFVSATEGGQHSTTYLHPVQSIPPPPKMTTTVRKDVDVMSGRKILNEYEISETLGEGVHGKVKCARHLVTGQIVAIKIVPRFTKRKRLGKASSPEDRVKREVAILKQAQHPNVVRMIEVIDDPEYSKIYIVLEYCEKKEINWRILGQSEIVILENRRLQLEQKGITDFHAVTYNDPTIQTNLKQLESQQRRSRRPHQSRSRSSYNWSLEHGDLSEEEDEGDFADDDDITPNDITPTTTHESRPVEQALHSRTSIEELAPHESAPSSSYGTSPRALSKSPTELAAAKREGEFGNLTSLGFASSWQSQQRHISSSYASGSGADPGRRASQAESIASQVTDMLEREVPDEELRYVPTMSIPEILSAFRDALIGIEYLHYQGIIHRDIKPANLLRTSTDQVKISDFGVSYLGRPIREGEESAEVSGSESQDPESEAELAKTVGTPAFYAPELCNLDFEKEMPRVTGQVDIWALGVTLYCMLFARTPFLADDQFELMRKIANEDVVIPERRLKAVQDKEDALSPFMGPQRRDPEKRLPGYWEHEYIDDELHDLLVRLLTKDPRARITLKEIKHHPWVLRGIDNPSQWIQETDPAYKAPAKIKVDEEALAKSIVPVAGTVLGRIKSITHRAGRALGIGQKASGERSGGHSEVGSSSSLQSAAEVPNRDPRRQSLILGDAITDALRASRDREHEQALARSAAPSPEPGSYRSSSRNSSRKSSLVPTHGQADTLAVPRPSMPSRDSPSNVSAADSVSTIRAGSYTAHVTPNIEDIQEHDFDGTGQIPALEYSGPALASVFGGAGSGKLFRRPISRQPSIQGHASSKMTSPEGTSSPETPYGEPTIALASAFAAGEVQNPSGLFEPGSITSSASSSRKSSAALMSRKSSTASQGGRRRGMSAASAFSPSPVLSSPGWHGGGQVDFGGGLSAGMATYSLKDEAATDDEYNHAMEAINRRRLLEVEQAREQHNASRNAAKAAKALNAPEADPSCPRSPDDDALAMPPPPRPDHKRSSAASDFFTEAHSMEHASPIAPISSASSEDPFRFSQTSSHPSIPSVSSYATHNLGESEVVNPAPVPKPALTDSTGSDDSAETLQESSYADPAASAFSPSASNRMSLPSRSVSYDPGYAVDDEDDDDDSEDDEEFLMMGKKQRSSRSGSISNAQLSRRNERRESVKMVRKNTRSGSTSTMKKIRSHSAGSSAGSDRRL